MIYTCTLNPSIDYLIELHDLKLGEVNRMDHEIKVPGGKGINVSRVLHRLGIDNKAIGFIGGFTGDFIRSYLESEKIKTDFVTIKGDSRINVKLKETKETEINGRGPTVEELECEELLKKLDPLREGDYLVLAGSIPESISSNFYLEMAERVVALNINLVVDTTKSHLMDLLPYQPFLLKPNKQELAEIFNVTIHTKEDAIPYGKKLVELGAKHVIVSLAGEGALYFSSMGVFYATVPKGRVRNSVGAGDSVVGGYLAATKNKKSPLEAFRYAVAAGTATAFSKSFCEQETVQELLEQIEIKEL